MSDAVTVFEEDVEQFVSDAETVLGKQGRMLPSSKTVKYNSFITLQTGDVIWYGDIDVKDDAKQLTMLAKMIGRPIYVRETNIGPVDDFIMFLGTD